MKRKLKEETNVGGKGKGGGQINDRSHIEDNFVILELFMTNFKHADYHFLILENHKQNMLLCRVE